MSTGFTELESKTVCYAGDGAMLYGEQKIGGKWYHFDGVTGAMSTGLTDLGYKTVLYGEDGAMLYGRQDFSGLGLRYFDLVTGELLHSRWSPRDDSNLSYYLDDDGSLLFKSSVSGSDRFLIDSDSNLLSGLVKSGGKAVYADSMTGRLLFGWINDSNGNAYFADDSGLLVSGERKLISNSLSNSASWYYFDVDSYALSHGWIHLVHSSKWVYYDDKSGEMLYGQQKLYSQDDCQDHWYNFDEVTGAAKYGFVWIRNQSKVVYYDPVMAWMLYGWRCVESVNYYFDYSDGHLSKLDTENSTINAYVNWALSIALDNSHGYDQQYRWGERGDYDCSSLVVSSLRVAGLNTGGSSYTGNMRSQLTQHGFVWITDFSHLKAGDILLNESHHTAIYLGNGLLVHASGNEFDDAVGGLPGDQTGEEIYIRTYYWRPWNGVLRLA